MSFITKAIITAQLNAGLCAPCVEDARHTFTSPLPVIRENINRMDTATFMFGPLLAREKLANQSA